MTGSSIDNNEERPAFFKIYSSSETRIGLLRRLADSIELANSVRPASWSVSLREDGTYVNLVVGRMFMLSLEPERVWVVLKPEALDEAARARLKEVGREEADEFATVPDARVYSLEVDAAAAIWDSIDTAHRAAVKAAAPVVQRTPYHSSHSDAVVEFLERALDRELPRPRYEEHSLSEARVEELLSLVRSVYPGWLGFEDPRFNGGPLDEVEYKLARVKKAEETISESELRRLIAVEGFDEYIDRVRQLGKNINLLWTQMASEGDLKLLEEDALDKRAFCEAFLDLLYGEGDAPARLDRYVGWVASAEVPANANKWTLPTYFLFIRYPDSEIFVKPQTTRRLIELGGWDIELDSVPTGEKYAAIRDAYVELREALQEFGPRHMIDVQGFAFVAASMADKRDKAHKRGLDPGVEQAMRDFEREVDAHELFEQEQLIAAARDRFREVFGTKRKIEELTPEAFFEFFNEIDTHGERTEGIFTTNLAFPKDPETQAFQALEEDISRLRSALTQLLHGEGTVAERIDRMWEIGSSVRRYITESLGVPSILLFFQDPELWSGVQLMSYKAAKLSAAGHAPDRPEGSSLGERFVALEHALVELPSLYGRDWSPEVRKTFYFSDAFERHLEAEVDPLQPFIDRFRSERGYPTEEDRKHLAARDELSESLSKSALEHPDRDRLKYLVSTNLYGSPGPQSTFNKYLNDATEAELARLGETLRNLLYGADSGDPLGARIDAALDADIAGLGEAIVTKMLSLVHPERFIPVFVTQSARAMGKKALMSHPALELEFPDAGTRGELAVETNDLLRERLEPWFGDDTFAMKEFLYWLNGQVKKIVTPPKVADRGFEALLESLREEGLHFPREVVANYILALQSKRFAILTGISGTGKTRLAIEVARHFRPSIRHRRTVESPDDAIEIDVVPSHLRYHQAVLPVALTSSLLLPANEPGSASSRIAVTYPEGETDLTIWRDPTRNVTKLIFRGAFREWFDSTLEEGERIWLRTREGADGAHDQLEIGLPSTEIVEEPLKNYKVIPVRPDWTDNRGLLGYFNPLTSDYSTTEFLSLLLRARREEEEAEAQGREPHPFFIVLDEMNLARVEHYFSDFLSALESEETIPLHEDAAIEAGESETGVAIPRELTVPSNVFFTGTVNVDETTYMFSPKVLDRAFTIELNRVDLEAYTDGGMRTEAPGLDIGDDSGPLLTPYTRPDRGDWEEFAILREGELHRRLLALHALLEGEHRHFGYRVANEIARFVNLAHRHAPDGSAVDAAFDLALLEKVLPKFHGTQQELEPVLDRLFFFALEGEDRGTRTEPLRLDGWISVKGRLEPNPATASSSDAEDTPNNSRSASNPVFPRTAAKLYRMLRRLNDQGFTSFIE